MSAAVDFDFVRRLDAADAWDRAESQWADDVARRAAWLEGLALLRLAEGHRVRAHREMRSAARRLNDAIEDAIGALQLCDEAGELVLVLARHVARLER
jgi:hypothetical protein